MDDNTYWLRLWQTVAGVVVLFTICIAGCDSYQTKKYIEAGYTRTALPGSAGYTWVKGD